MPYLSPMPYTEIVAPRAEPTPIQVSPQGRIVIPKALRQALGLKPGDTLVAWLEGDRLILRPRQAVEEELWALMRDVKESLADELIEERRREAEREG